MLSYSDKLAYCNKMIYIHVHQFEKKIKIDVDFFLKRRFIEINKTIYRIVEMKDIRNTAIVKRN